MSDQGPATTRLVVLDRDGVINHDSSEFVKSADEWLPLDGSIGAIARLSRAGYTVAVATNQSGIARGLIDDETLAAMHEKMSSLVAAAGGRIGHIAWCPHHPDDECVCRKPAPGLLLQIGARYHCSMKSVPVIGDSLRDLEAALAADARPILVRTGNGAKTAANLPASLADVEVFENLGAAADALLAE